MGFLQVISPRNPHIFQPSNCGPVILCGWVSQQEMNNPPMLQMQEDPVQGHFAAFFSVEDSKPMDPCMVKFQAGRRRSIHCRMHAIKLYLKFVHAISTHIGYTWLTWFVLITFLNNLTMILQEKLTHENPMSPSSTWNPVDSIGILLASPLIWLQPYVHCWHTIWIRDRKPSWGPEVGEGGGWREDGVTLLPKKKMGEKSFSWGSWDECFATWRGLMYCFCTTSQTKRLKKIVVFVFVCFCLTLPEWLF